MRVHVLAIAGLTGLALAQPPAPPPAPSPAPEWSVAASGVTARLRGVSAASDRVIWASGADGTVIRTSDAGASWQRLFVPEAADLDFRDIDAVSESVAYLLSIGPGDRSRIYKTTDAGQTWTRQFVNADPAAFFDAMAFWDERRGVAFSDAADARFHLRATTDGGASWRRVPTSRLPPALPNEGAFAASGTNVATYGSRHVWIGTGGAAQARVLRSTDGGQTWDVSTTPLAAGPSSGIFSVAFQDARHGIVVGGDYTKAFDAVHNAAVTDDGGATWTLVDGLTGFRSVVRYLPDGGPGVIAIGPSGADYSPDGGRTWRAMNGPGFHAFSASPDGRVGVGVGEGGRAGLLLAAGASRVQAAWTPLWNGRDLEGWTTWLRQPEATSMVAGLARDAEGRYTEPIGSGRDPLGVFTVVPDVDGRSAIRISGEVFGELRTVGSYHDYHLKLQFKWGEKKWPPRDRPETPRDSGILYHVHSEAGAEGRTWARSVELQIQEHDVGDLYAVGSAIAVRSTARPGPQPRLYEYDPSGEWMYFSQSHGSMGRCIKMPDNERPFGEWNTVEVIVLGEQALHVVNGVVVMRLHGARRIAGDKPTPVISGPILLQSEGAEVFFRDIEMRPIAALPPEYDPALRR